MKEKMKRGIGILLICCMLLTLLPGAAFAEDWNTVYGQEEEASIYTRGSSAESEQFFAEAAQLIADTWCDGFFGEIVFVIGEPYMWVDGVQHEINPTRQVSPAMIDGEALIPLCVLVAETGGTISVDVIQERIVIEDDYLIELEIGADVMYIDGEVQYFDATPVIVNDSVLLPVDAIFEELGFEVDWEPGSEQVTLTRAFQMRRLLVRTEAEKDFSNLDTATILHGPDIMTVLQFETRQDAQDVHDWLSELEHVIWVEPDIYIPPMLLAPYIAETTDFTPVNTTHRSWGVERIGADKYAELLRDSGRLDEVIVAVLDTGVYSDHPFLQDRMLPGRCLVSANPLNPYDAHGHGTHVAGTVVDSTPGLNVQILPVKVLQNSGGGSSFAISNGVRWAAARSDVINMSLGGLRNLAPPSDVMAVYEAIQYAIRERDTTVVVAAGNRGTDAIHYWPAYIHNVITVAAMDSEDRPAIFTNYGSVDIAAPGVSIVSSVPINSSMDLDPDVPEHYRGTGFIPASGTSMAAPHAAAMAAMYILEHPGISSADVHAALREYVDIPDGWNTNRYGTGILDMRPFIGQVRNIWLTPRGRHAFPSVIVGYGAQTAHSVTVRNMYNQATGALTVALSGSNADSFTLSRTSIPSIDISGNDSFTVVPNTGLAAGTYTATVTVSGGVHITPQSFNVSFTVVSHTVNTWDELRYAVDAAPAGDQTTLLIARNLTTTDAINPNAIHIPADKDIVLESNTPGTNRYLTMRTLFHRHFTVSGQLTLRDGITLRGDWNAGGVEILANGALTMEERSVIENCRWSGAGGGVSVNGNNATFSLAGGTIRNNSALFGGGVAMLTHANTRVYMSSGSIEGNTASNSGGGVAMSPSDTATFTMTGGSIRGNTAPRGGGAFVIATTEGAFTITGGSMTHNAATGPGVANGGGAIFSTRFGDDADALLTDWDNLHIGAYAVFYDNKAGVPTLPPDNAETLPHLRSKWTSINWHILNNYDINFPITGERAHRITFHFDADDRGHSGEPIRVGVTPGRVIDPAYLASHGIPRDHILTTGTPGIDLEQGLAFWGWFREADLTERPYDGAYRNRPIIRDNSFAAGFDLTAWITQDIIDTYFDEDVYRNLDLYIIWSHWGDADDNGVVDQFDVTLIRQYLHDRTLISFEEPPRFNNPINLSASNVTVSPNGRVDEEDVIRFNHWLHDQTLIGFEAPPRFFAVLGNPNNPRPPARSAFSDLGRAEFSYQNWFADAIELMLELETTLSLDEKAVRAMALSMLHHLLGSPDVEFGSIFGDVPLDQWYSVAVTWVEESGLADWDEDGALLHRFAALMG